MFGNNFSTMRMALLFKRDLIIHRKTLVLWFSSILLISLTFAFLTQLLLPPIFLGNGRYRGIAEVIIALLAISVSYSFYELDFAEKKIDYLLIPASTLEKYLGRLIVTSVGYLLIGSMIYFISLIFLGWIQTHAFSVWNEKALLQPGYLIRLVQIYLSVHSFFFFGSVYFKKNESGKILRTGFVIYGSFILLRWIISCMFSFHWPIMGPSESAIRSLDENSKMEYYKLLAATKSIVSVTFFYLMPVFLWGLGYLRLKEEEARNGI